MYMCTLRRGLRDAAAALGHPGELGRRPGFGAAFC